MHLRSGFGVAVIVLCVFTAFSGVGLIIGMQAPRQALSLLTPAHAEVVGAPNSRLTAEFQFQNATGHPVRPRVVATSCACNEYDFEPDVIAPGATGVFRAYAHAPIWGGAVGQQYVIRCSEEEDYLKLTVTCMAADGPGIGIAPTRLKYADVRAQVPPAPADSVERLEVTLDVVYSLPSGVPNPKRDLKVTEQSVRVVAIDVLNTASGVRSRFSGRVRMSLELDSAVRATEKFSLHIASTGAPAPATLELCP